ncbi:MAG: HAD-IIIC family phosphatase [Coxiellaceae bacterium]|jgi:FkbH-like protein|nr:HAD-IIIC family phosphatase [Coxiellaceae bacterium]
MSKPSDEHQIKCAVWDLDNTLWQGTLLEDQTVIINPQVVKVIETLDQRGILQSIASKNNHDDAIAKLKSFGLDEYFLYPQINWEPKSNSMAEIAKRLNINLDTFAFIDDQQFELDEVKFSQPKILTVNAQEIPKILDMPLFIPRFITDDSKIRRKMYQCDIRRNNIEETFAGSKDDFLRTLDMKLTIAKATEDDLQRAEELTLRTHQLNTTGYTYSYDELNFFRTSDSHTLLIAGLEDKYGPYGKIGLILLEENELEWRIKLLLMSCRVMSRGIGAILINYLREAAKKHKVKLTAEFIPTDRNRMMFMAYKFANFIEREEQKRFILFENDLKSIPAMPSYVRFIDNANI